MSQVYGEVGECRVAMLKTVIHQGLFSGHRSEDWKEVWAHSLCLLANSWPRGLGRAGQQVRQPELRGFLLGRTVDRYAESEVEGCPSPKEGCVAWVLSATSLGNLTSGRKLLTPPPPPLPSAESCLRPESLQISPSPAPAWPSPLPHQLPSLPRWLFPSEDLSL